MQPRLVRYAMAVAFTAVAVLVRLAIDPILGDRVTYAIAFSSVAASVWFSGRGPGILSTVLGFLAADWFFVHPRHTIGFTSPTDLAGIGVYFATSLTIVFFGYSMHRARDKALSRQIQLEQRAAELNSVLNSMADALSILDASGRVVRMNVAARRLFGRGRREMGESIPDRLRLLGLSKEDGTPFDLEESASYRALQGETVLSFIERMQSGSDRTWLSVNAAPICAADGDVLGAVTTYRDITEQVDAEEALWESEERYRQVIEHTTAIILRVDPQARITFANTRALEFFGYSSDELIGRRVVGTIVPEQESTGRDLSRMVDEIAENPDHFHYNINESMCKNGELVWLEWTNSGIYDSDGALTGFLSVGIDVTDKVHAQQQMERLEAEKVEFYRRTILAATEDKLLIAEPAEIAGIAGPSVASWEIDTPADISSVRREIGRMACAEGIEQPRLAQLEVAVGEAITNAVKHASHGAVSLHRTDDALIVLVSDRGTGIPTPSLPDVALRPGYSTAGTLGMGYKLMLQFADKVYLATGPEGTTVGILISPRPVEQPVVDRPLVAGGGQRA